MTYITLDTLCFINVASKCIQFLFLYILIHVKFGVPEISYKKNQVLKTQAHKRILGPLKATTEHLYDLALGEFSVFS